MRDERNDLAQQEVSLPKLPGRGYGKREKKGPGAGKIVAAVLAAALVRLDDLLFVQAQTQIGPPVGESTLPA